MANCRSILWTPERYDELRNLYQVKTKDLKRTLKLMGEKSSYKDRTKQLENLKKTTSYDPNSQCFLPLKRHWEGKADYIEGEERQASGRLRIPEGEWAFRTRQVSSKFTFQGYEEAKESGECKLSWATPDEVVEAYSKIRSCMSNSTSILHYINSTAQKLLIMKIGVTIRARAVVVSGKYMLRTYGTSSRDITMMNELAQAQGFKTPGTRDNFIAFDFTSSHRKKEALKQLSPTFAKKVQGYGEIHGTLLPYVDNARRHFFSAGKEAVISPIMRRSDSFQLHEIEDFNKLIQAVEDNKNEWKIQVIPVIKREFSRPDTVGGYRFRELGGKFTSMPITTYRSSTYTFRD